MARVKFWSVFLHGFIFRVGTVKLVDKEQFTMRKNLPKILDQLIFCKYTLVFSKSSQIY